MGLRPDGLIREGEGAYKWQVTLERGTLPKRGTFFRPVKGRGWGVCLFPLTHCLFCHSNSMLISYTQDSTQEQWKGYVYAVSMFLVSVFMSAVSHQYWQIVFVLGMRIRTALIGMVYAKVHCIYGFLLKSSLR